MRYGISPAERNMAMDDLKKANRTQEVSNAIPRLRRFSLEEKMEEQDHKALVKNKLYGRMSHRKKPNY